MPYQQYDVYYWMSPEGKLRHKHLVGGASDFDRSQWHDVEQYHRLNPTVHEDLKAWDIDSIGWSEKNYFTRAEQIDLLAKAERDTSQNKPLTFDPGYSYPKHTPPDEDYKAAEGEPEPAPPISTPVESTGDEIIDMLAALPSRVDSLEAGTAALASQQSELKQRITDASGRIASLNTEVGRAIGNAATLERKILDHEAVVDARFRPLEEAAARKVEIVLHRPDLPDKAIHLNGTDHPKLAYLIKLVSLLNPEDRNVWIAGPAGSSKTSSAYKLAEALDLDFSYLPAISQPHEYLGYRNATGEYISTEFRLRYEHGGVCLFDEIDGSNATALLPLNGALSGPQCSFPDGMVKRHPDFILLCAGNTWGHGSTVEYVGRLAQDAAFLDRFRWVEWPYDEAFELGITLVREWTLVVQAIRAAAALQKAKIVVSPRSSIVGGQLLSRGMSREDVVNAIFGRYRNRIGDWSIIGKAAEDYIKAEPKPEADPSISSTCNEALLDQVRALLQQHNRIPAMKLWRDSNSVSWEEAKDFIDKLEAQIPAGSPNGLVKTVDFTGVRVY